MIRIVRWPSARCWRTRRIPSGNDLRHDHLGEHLPGVALDLLDRGVLVAAVEVAQEVGAVGAVELQQARPLGDACAASSGPARGCRGGGWRATSSSRRRSRRSACSRGRTRRPDAWGRAPACACRAMRSVDGDGPGVVLTRACWTIDGQVDLGDVGRPVDRAGVEVELGPIGVARVRPTCASGCRPGRSPRTRCTGRTARRT